MEVTSSCNTSPGRVEPVVRPYSSMSTGSTPKKSRLDSRQEQYRPQSRQEQIRPQSRQENIYVAEKDANDDIELQKEKLLQEILNKEPTEDQEDGLKPEQAVDDEDPQSEEEIEPKDDNADILPERPKSAASWNSRSSKMQYIKRLEELLRQERAKGHEARKKSREIINKH